LGKGSADDFGGAFERGLKGRQGLERLERFAGGFFKNTHDGGLRRLGGAEGAANPDSLR
jgi:hypothetical protein